MKLTTGTQQKTFAGLRPFILLCFLSLPGFAINAQADTVAPSTVVTDETASTSIAPPKSITAPVNANKPVLTTPKKISSSSQLASLLGGLILILGLIYGLSWFVKRFSQGGFMQNSTIKMVAAMPLGTRERIMLVDVGGQQILLGVTATQINALHVFEQPVVSADNANPTPSDFSQKLMGLLQKNMAQQKNAGSVNLSEHKNIKQ